MNRQRVGLAGTVFAIITSVALVACQKSGSGSAATSPASIPNPFQHNEDIINRELSPDALAKADGVDGVAFSAKENCAEQICGNPLTAKSPYDIFFGRFQATPETDNSTALLKPDLDAIFTATIENRRRDDIELKARLNGISNLTLSQPYRIMANTLWSFSKASAINQSLTDNNEYVVDASKLKSNASGLSQEDRDFLKLAFDDFLQSPEVRAMKTIENVGLRDLLRFYYPGESIEDAEVSLGNALKVPVERLESRFPRFFEQNKSKAVSRLLAKSPLSDELAQRVEAAYVLSFIESQMEKQSSIFASRRVPVADLVAALKSSDALDQELASFNDSAQVAAKKLDAMDRCQIYLTAAILAAPTTAELAYFQSLVPQIKESVLKSATALKPSDDAVKAIAANVSRTQLVLPSSRDEFVAELRRVFQAQLESLTSPSQLSDEDFFLRTMSFQSLKAGEIGNDICGDFEPTDITDATVNILSEIHVSWQTVRFPEFGIGVLGHELGHVVSYSIKSSPKEQPEFTSFRACTNSQHGALDSKHDQIYEEEDFADFIGAKVTQDLSNHGLEADNIGCLLLGENKARWGVFGLSLKASATNLDVHSTNLFRTIKVQSDSGRTLPPACQSLVDTSAPDLKKSCAP